MIKIKNGKVSIEKTKKLKRKHLANLSKLFDSDERQAYLMSLVGLNKNSIGEIRYNRLSLKREPVKYSPLANFLDRVNNNSAGANHKPQVRKDSSRWIGVEIECLIEGDSTEQDCENSDNECHNCGGNGVIRLEDDDSNEYSVQCRSCNGRGSIDNECDCEDCNGEREPAVYEELRRELLKAGVKRASVRSDGSVYDMPEYGLVGVEVTLLFDMSHGFGQLEKLIGVLKKFKAQVNHKCGLHVHLDASKIETTEQLQRRGERFGRFLPFLSSLVPVKRRSNDFCKLSVSDTSGHERYHAVNLNSWRRHKTIEIRLHSGTVNFYKIKNWIIALQAINQLPKTPPVRCYQNDPINYLDYQNFEAVLSFLIPETQSGLKDYFRKRRDKFKNGEANDEGSADLDVTQEVVNG